MIVDIPNDNSWTDVLQARLVGWWWRDSSGSSLDNTEYSCTDVSQARLVGWWWRDSSGSSSSPPSSSSSPPPSSPTGAQRTRNRSFFLNPQMPLSFSMYFFKSPYQVKHAQLKRKSGVAGIPRYCTDWFMILQEQVHAFPIFMLYHELIRAVSRANSCSISEFLLHFIFFLTV